MYHFFFNDTATTEIYTLSLHDALPISMNPFSTATQTMLGSVASRVQKSGAPGAGPQSTMRSRPAASVSCTMAATPPSIWETRKASVRAPAPRNISAWNTFVHTTAETPPVAMYAIDTTTVTTIVV